MTGNGFSAGFGVDIPDCCAFLMSSQKSTKYSFFSDNESFMENPSEANCTSSCAVSILAPSVLKTLLEIKKGVWDSTTQSLTYHLAKGINRAY